MQRIILGYTTLFVGSLLMAGAALLALPAHSFADHGPTVTCQTIAGQHRCHTLWGMEYSDTPVRMVWVRFGPPMQPCLVDPQGGNESMAAVQLWLHEKADGTGEYIELGIDSSRFIDTEAKRNIFSAANGGGYEPYGLIWEKGFLLELVDQSDGNRRWKLWSHDGQSGYEPLRTFNADWLARGLFLGSETSHSDNDVGVQTLPATWVKNVGELEWFGVPGPFSSHQFPWTSLPDSHRFSRHRMKQKFGNGLGSRVGGTPGWVQFTSDHHFMPAPVYDNCGNQLK